MMRERKRGPARPPTPPGTPGPTGPADACDLARLTGQARPSTTPRLHVVRISSTVERFYRQKAHETGLSIPELLAAVCAEAASLDQLDQSAA